MKKQIAQLWVKALRSGKYKQGIGRLCKSLPSGDRFCCLGVLTELYIQDYNRKHKNKIGWESAFPKFSRNSILKFDSMYDDLSPKVMKWAGMKSEDGTPDSKDFIFASLADLNDHQQNFKQIAETIEKYYEVL